MKPLLPWHMFKSGDYLLPHPTHSFYVRVGSHVNCELGSGFPQPKLCLMSCLIRHLVSLVSWNFEVAGYFLLIPSLQK